MGFLEYAEASRVCQAKPRRFLSRFEEIPWERNENWLNAWQWREPWKCWCISLKTSYIISIYWLMIHLSIYEIYDWWSIYDYWSKRLMIEITIRNGDFLQLQLIGSTIGYRHRYFGDLWCSATFCCCWSIHGLSDSILVFQAGRYISQISSIYIIYPFITLWFFHVPVPKTHHV